MTDKDTTQKTTIKKRAARSTGFPVISLPAAAKIIREAGAYGKQHTDNALASYAGHKTANSGTWKAKAAALKDWGLISGTPATSYVLTDRAWMLAHPASAEAAQKALLEAFTNCQLFMGLYDDMAKGQDLKTELIGNKAVNEKGVAATSKEQFVRSFTDSAIAVGLAEQASADTVRLLAPGFAPQTPEGADDTADSDEVDASVPAPGNAPGQTADDPAVRKPRQRVPSDTTAPLIHQVWELAGGEISFSVSSAKPLDASVFADLGSVVQAIEKLATAIGVPEQNG